MIYEICLVVDGVNPFADSNADASVAVEISKERKRTVVMVVNEIAAVLVEIGGTGEVETVEKMVLFQEQQTTPTMVVLRKYWFFDLDFVGSTANVCSLEKTDAFVDYYG